MTDFAIIMILYMFASLIYTELIFPIISKKAKNQKIEALKPVGEIVKEILCTEGLWGKVEIDMSEEREAGKSFYAEKSQTIEISCEDKTAEALGAAIHECGHAVQYNKSWMAIKVIKIRDSLKKFKFLDTISPLAVPFFEAFNTPLYIASCFFLVKLVARVIVEFLVEADANIKARKYLKKYIPNKSDRKSIERFLTACSLTYLSTVN